MSAFLKISAAILLAATMLGACAGTGTSQQQDENYRQQQKDKYGHV